MMNVKHGKSSISHLFLKVKNLCLEINLFNSKDPVLVARIMQCIIWVLYYEYIPFVTPIQGCIENPSLEEFENLSSS